MENVVFNSETDGGTFKQSDLLFPCNSVERKYAPSCYHYHTTYMMKQMDYRITETFDECDKITPQDLVRYCYHGMGRQLSPTSNNPNLSQIICTEGSQDDYHTDCLRGMLMTVINRNTDPVKGFQFCKSLIKFSYI